MQKLIALMTKEHILVVAMSGIQEMGPFVKVLIIAF